MDHCWILVGMMGSGKSTVGRKLAEISERSFDDTDLMLERRFGRTVQQIFKIYGEEAFRGHETSVLRSVTVSDCVLATGGGIVVREENWSELRRLGITVYLKADADTLTQRLEQSKKKRPLLAVEDWEGKVRDLLEAREPMYQRADVVFEVGNDPIDIAAQRLLSRLIEFEQGAKNANP